ncbi:MAG: hypothetical protein SO253_02535 [Bacilli bacterium]|nr:hypothetical protein [Bacilli bacterium]
MKKINIGILSLTLLMGLGLASCSSNENSSSPSAGGSVIKTKEEVFAYSTFSSSALLSNSMQATTMLTKSEVTSEQIDKINNYINIFDGLVNGDGLKQETIVNTDEDYKEYETKMIVSYQDTNYVAYYNETPVNDTDDDIDEVETTLDGIMLMNDITYKISGTKEVERDEIETTIKSYIDENNWVIVEQSIENGEQEFEYHTKVNGVEEYSSVEIEMDKKNQIEVELQFGKDDDKALIYEFKKVTANSGNEIMHIDVFNGEDNLVEKIIVKSYINKETGEKVNEYIFKDGSSITKKDRFDD